LASAGKTRQRAPCSRPLAKRYDFLAELLSFGQNARWHRRPIEVIAPSNPATVLDLATGTGLVAMRIAGSDRASWEPTSPDR